MTILTIDNGDKLDVYQFEKEGRQIISIPVKETILLPEGENKEDYVVYEGRKEDMKVVYRGENIK
jgi:hypothetical protein